MGCMDRPDLDPDTCLAWKKFGFCDKVWPGTNDVQEGFSAVEEDTLGPMPTKVPIENCIADFTTCQADAHSLKELRACSQAFGKCKFGYCRKVCHWEQTVCHAKADTKEAIIACKSLWKPCMTKNGC